MTTKRLDELNKLARTITKYEFERVDYYKKRHKLSSNPTITDEEAFPLNPPSSVAPVKRITYIDRVVMGESVTDEELVELIDLMYNNYFKSEYRKSTYCLRHGILNNHSIDPIKRGESYAGYEIRFWAIGYPNKDL